MRNVPAFLGLATTNPCDARDLTALRWQPDILELCGIAQTAEVFKIAHSTEPRATHGRETCPVVCVRDFVVVRGGTREAFRLTGAIGGDAIDIATGCIAPGHIRNRSPVR